MMVALICISFFLQPDQGSARPSSDPFRPQKYALFRAHKILPPTLSQLVQLNGKFLFSGFEQGVRLPQSQVTAYLILNEKEKITQLVNQQAPFSRVITQMGYVGGLLSVYLNPSLSASKQVQQGFPFYLNTKLPRFLFVFDGYSSLKKLHGGSEGYLLKFGEFRTIQSGILQQKYESAGQNPYHIFSEQSAVFGISSVYFSNLASSSAHLWYDAWEAAKGDTNRTPYLAIQTTPIKKGQWRASLK